MLSGIVYDNEIRIKIIDDGKFQDELALMKELKGKFDWQTKDWLFPLTQKDELIEHGLQFQDTQLDKVYPVPCVNKERAAFLRAYQWDPLTFMLSRGGRVLLADDVGLGKTLTSIGFFAYTKINYPLLIITTASTKTQWEYEYNRFNEWGKKTFICEGIQSIGVIDADVVIVNYDILSYHIKNVSTNKWKPKYEPTDALKLLKSMQFQGMILDECQRLKSDTSFWTQAIKYLATDIPHILALSATPIENKPKEFFNVLNILRPDIWNNYMAFTVKYCDAHKAYRWIMYRGKKKRQEYIDDNGASNQEELFQVVRHHVMYRRNKHEAIEGLPKAVPITLPLILVDSDLKLYWDIVEGKEKIYTKEGKEIKSTNTLVRNNYLKEFSATKKLDYVIQFLKDFLQDTDEKIVVFTEHHTVIDELHKHFEKESVVYDGRCTAKEKDKAKQKFIENKKTRIILGQIKSMGEGVNGLQTVSNKMMIVELPYNPMLIYQAIGRLERVGSSADTVSVYFPILRDTVEETIMNMLMDKTTNVLSILDGQNAKIKNIGKEIHDYLHSVGLDTN